MGGAPPRLGVDLLAAPRVGARVDDDILRRGIHGAGRSDPVDLATGHEAREQRRVGLDAHPLGHSLERAEGGGHPRVFREGGQVPQRQRRGGESQ